MLGLVRNINPADLTAFARSVPTPSDLLLTREVLPNATLNNVKYRIKSSTRYQNTAKFRAWDTETPRGRRDVTHSVMEGQLPPLGQKLDVGELETILLSLSRGADDTELVDALYDDVENHVQAIRNRLELAAGDLLADGIFTLTDENGLTLQADFSVPSGNRPTVATFWSDTVNSKPLDDERAWKQYLADNGAPPPARLIGSHLVFTYYAQNAQYKEAFYGRNQASYPTLTPGQVQTVRDSWQLPPITEYDTMVRVDGVSTRTFPQNRVLYIPANPASTLGETQYGITAEAIVLSSSGNPRITREDQPGIVVTAYEQDDPVRAGTKGTAVAMPLLYDPTAYISARVLT